MTQNNPKRALIAGALWTVGMRWAVRGLGFCNTLIMARILMPADYGIVAMAMLVVGLVQALLDTGTITALLRKSELTRDEIDSAWTLRLIEFVLVGLIIAAVSYPASLYFQEPRVIPALLTIAACGAVQGFMSIGIVLAQKELNFSVEFRLVVICNAIRVVVTILSGLMLRDYRALIIGLSSGYIATTIISYALHPYRARWNVSRIAEIWHLTKWLMLAGIANYTLRKGDELIAARLGGAQQFGLYNVGADLGQMPTGEVGPAMLKAFLPVLSTMQDDVDRTNRAVLKTIAAINTLVVPIGTLMAVLSVPLTSLILGSTWQAAAPVVGVFALVSTGQILVMPLNHLLILRGYTRLQSSIIWLEFATFLLAAAAMVPHFGILMGLAYARLLGTATNAALSIFHAHSRCDVAYAGVAAALYRPVLGAILIAVLSALCGHWFAAPLLNVVMVVALGLLAYGLWCAGSWHLAGRPEGLESTIVDRWQLRETKSI